MHTVFQPSHRILGGGRSTLRFLVFAVFSCSVATAEAQQGAEILEGLLKDLLQSRVERYDNPRDIEDDPRLVRGRRSDRQRRPDRVPDVVLQAGRRYGEFANEAQRLVRLLQQEAARTPGVRQELDEILKLQMRAQLMSERFRTPQKEDFILDNMRALDRDWRTAAYRMNSVRGLSNACRQSVKRISALNEQCCGLLNLQPQIDRRELVRLTDALASQLHHLESDVEFEVRSRPKARELVMRLRRLEARARLLSDSIADRDAPELVVEEFQQFLLGWRSIEQDLAGFQDRHVDRTIEQIHELHRGIQEHLRIPLTVDRTRVKHLALSAQQRITAIGDTFSLTMLTELPEPVTVLRAAQTLNTETLHLCQEIEANSPDEMLVEHWVELSNAWQAFDQHTAAISSPRLRTLRQETSGHVEALREVLGIQLAFDRNAVARAIAELEGIAEQAQQHVALWQRRPGAVFDTALIRASETLITDIHQLHEQCVATTSREELAEDCQQLAAGWSKLRPRLLACKTVDQRALRRISDNATAKLIELQTLLAY